MKVNLLFVLDVSRTFKHRLLSIGYRYLTKLLILGLKSRENGRFWGVANNFIPHEAVGNGRLGKVLAHPRRHLAHVCTFPSAKGVPACDVVSFVESQELIRS